MSAAPLSSCPTWVAVALDATAVRLPGPKSSPTRSARRDWSAARGRRAGHPPEGADETRHFVFGRVAGEPDPHPPSSLGHAEAGGEARRPEVAGGDEHPLLAEVAREIGRPSPVDREGNGRDVTRLLVLVAVDADTRYGRELLDEPLGERGLVLSQRVQRFARALPIAASDEAAETADRGRKARDPLMVLRAGLELLGAGARGGRHLERLEVERLLHERDAHVRA